METAPDFRLGVVRSSGYGQSGAPGTFMPQLRGLGSRLVRVTLTWDQIQPGISRYDWTAVDALLAQVEPGDEVWVTVVSASRWATKVPAAMLPASRARDNAVYGLFLGALVSRCAGKVTHWQCNSEPANPANWAGSADDYAAQAIALAKVVRSLDPRAKVVLGGCGDDMFALGTDGTARAFFETVLDRARDAYDLFALNLTGDPSLIPQHVADARMMMLRHGSEREIVIGEYGGPNLRQFPAAEAVMQQVAVDAWRIGPALPMDNLARQEEPQERVAMQALYTRMAELPAELQMFMRGCPPMLEAKRHRIACREIVTRNLLAFAAGIRRTCCFSLAPEHPNARDPLSLQGLAADKLTLMDFDADGALTKREPAGDAFARLAAALDGMTAIRRAETAPGIVVMEIARARSPLLVLWIEGDVFTGEDQAPQLVEWPWPHDTIRATDATGGARPLVIVGGKVSVGVGTTPLLLEP